MPMNFTITVGNAGWVRLQHDLTDLTAYIRFTADSQQRLVAREMVVDATSGGPITPKLLSQIPMREVQSLVNSPDDELGWVMSFGVDAAVPVGGPETGSNVAVLASHFATSFGSGSNPADDWCHAAQRSLADGKPIKKRNSRSNRRNRNDAFRLTYGPGPDGLTDDFLRNVGQAHAAAVARGEAPNVTIAKDSLTPRNTVARWVALARQRHLMPQASTKGSRY